MNPQRHSTLALTALLMAALCPAQTYPAQTGAAQTSPAQPGAAQPGLTSDFSPATVVATVDGEALTLGELMVRFATLPQPQRDRYLARREGLRDFLSDVVANLLVARQAAGAGVEEDPLYPLLMKIHREEVQRDLYARRTVLAPIDEATVAARYEARRELAFERQPLVRARHILVTAADESPSARAKIEEIRSRLAAGDDFAELARERSEDASAGAGGDLGWVAHGELAPALEKAVFSLAAGEVSGVIETELGFHVAQVVERRPGGLVPYELVRELLFQELVGERAVYFADSAREDRDRLVAEHTVELFPERLPW